ncbi:hypothetical protein [Amycolatopsis sp. NPDC051128]|uniref:hypothetical protein n=1 Tax=Amycolatopsis sp. NPDC051128 TaxID=3155412 RepID=UPI00342826B5
MNAPVEPALCADITVTAPAVTFERDAVIAAAVACGGVRRCHVGEPRQARFRGADESFTVAGLAMAFKLIEAAQARWRAVNAPHLVALVRAGAQFERGHLVERAAQ